MGCVSGKRVLIVEDNQLIGSALADVITRSGGEPLGPCTTERAAIDALEDNPEAAILDVHVDCMTFELAAMLRERDIPFIFATGSPDEVPESFQDVELCRKPYTLKHLMHALDGAITSQHN